MQHAPNVSARHQALCLRLSLLPVLPSLVAAASFLGIIGDHAAAPLEAEDHGGVGAQRAPNVGAWHHALRLRQRLGKRVYIQRDLGVLLHQPASKQR